MSINLVEILDKYKERLSELNSLGLNKQGIPGYVKGSIRTCEAQTLYSLIREFKFKNIIDVGTGPGFSAWYFAQALKDEQLEGIIETIDTGPDIELTSGMLSNHGLEDYVNFNIGLSTGVLPSLGKLKKEWDMVLIDGDHSYEQTKIDFENAFNLIKPGGCIVFHDVYPTPGCYSIGPRDVIQDVIDEEMGEVVFFEEEIFNYFNYQDDVQDVIRIGQKWIERGYGSWVDRKANPKELMAVFFKK